MAELQPRRIARFYYILQCNEQYSPFQAEAFTSLHWEGLILPERGSQSASSQILRAEVENAISLSTLLQTRPDPQFIYALLKHLIALQEQIRRTHLMAQNLCIEPDAILFPLPHSEAKTETIRAEEALLFYLPIWKESQETWEPPLQDPDSLHAYTGAESARLGLLEKIWSCLKVENQPEAVQKQGIQAASQSLVALCNWMQSLMPSPVSTTQDSLENLQAPTGITTNLAEQAEPTATVPILPPELRDLVQERSRRRRSEEALATVSCTQNVSQVQRKQLRFLHICVFIAQILFLISAYMLHQQFVTFQKKGWRGFFLLFFLLSLILDLRIWHTHSKQEQTQNQRNSEEFRRMKHSVKEEMNPAMLGPMEQASLAASPQFQIPNHNPFNRRYANPAYISKALPGSRTEMRSDRTYLINPDFHIGSNPINCDLILEEPYRPRPVAKIQKNESGYTLQKLDDLCIRINGQALQTQDPTPLPDQATLTFGQKSYYFQSQLRSTPKEKSQKSSFRVSTLLPKRPSDQLYHIAPKHGADSYSGEWHGGNGCD